MGLGGRTAVSYLLDDRLLDLGGGAALLVGVRVLDLLACEGTSRESAWRSSSGRSSSISFETRSRDAALSARILARRVQKAA